MQRYFWKICEAFDIYDNQINSNLTIVRPRHTTRSNTIFISQIDVIRISPSSLIAHASQICCFHRNDDTGLASAILYLLFMLAGIHYAFALTRFKVSLQFRRPLELAHCTPLPEGIYIKALRLGLKKIKYVYIWVPVTFIMLSDL